MTTAPTAHRPATSADTPALIDLVAALRQVIGMRADWAHTANLVADRVRAHLPGPGHPDPRPAPR
jgi:hypothetical protein